LQLQESVISDHNKCKATLLDKPCVGKALLVLLAGVDMSNFTFFGIFNFFFSCDAEVVVLLLFAMEKSFLQNQPYKIHEITSRGIFFVCTLEALECSSDIFLFAP